MFASTCFKARYTYLASSVNKDDSGQLTGMLDSLFNSGMAEMERSVIALENQDDLRDLQEFAVCEAD